MSRPNYYSDEKYENLRSVKRLLLLQCVDDTVLRYHAACDDRLQIIFSTIFTIIDCAGIV